MFDPTSDFKDGPSRALRMKMATWPVLPLNGPIVTMHTVSASGLERGERDSDSRVHSEGSDLLLASPLSTGQRQARVWELRGSGGQRAGEISERPDGRLRERAWPWVGGGNRLGRRE